MAHAAQRSGLSSASCTGLAGLRAVHSIARSPVRSTVRRLGIHAFKGADDNGVKQALRLSFRIPYRVNFGQSLGLVGSGESLGNWDPKRTVHMKWSDGDNWTVELTAPVSQGSTLDLEYKYVVVNSDGQVGYWKPGSNYRVTLPLNAQGRKLLKRVKVADAWDDSFKKVDVEEAEAPQQPSQQAGSNGASSSNSSSSSNNNGVSAPAASNNVVSAPAASNNVVSAPAASSNGVSAQAVSNNGVSAQAASLNGKPPPQAAAAQPASAGPAQASSQAKAGPGSPASNGRPAAAAAPSSTPLPQGKAAAPAAAQAKQKAAPPRTGTPPRSASPMAGPASFAAVTSIPRIHPSLLAEQERLEDGVKNSLEDLQTQMDKHQSLREKTDDPAAVEVLVADRIVAAANNRVVAYNKALKAVQEYNRLPPTGPPTAE